MMRISVELATSVHAFADINLAKGDNRVASSMRAGLNEIEKIPVEPFGTKTKKGEAF